MGSGINAELSAVGVGIGGAFSVLNNLLVNSHKKKEGKKWKPAVPVPDVKTSALGMGAFLGLSCNARYQLIGGADRWMTDRLTSLGSAITATALIRLTNNQGYSCSACRCTRKGREYEAQLDTRARRRPKSRRGVEKNEKGEA